MTQDTLVSIDEAARTLSVSRGQIYRLARRNQIRIVKLGRRSVIRASEIARVMNALPDFKSEAAA